MQDQEGSFAIQEKKMATGITGQQHTWQLYQKLLKISLVLVSQKWDDGPFRSYFLHLFSAFLPCLNFTFSAHSIFFHPSLSSHLLSWSSCPCFSPLFTFQQANSSSGACSAGCDSTPCLHFPPSSGSAVPPQCCSPETPTARSSLSSHLSSLSRLRKIMEGRQVDTERGEMCHTHCSQPFWRSQQRILPSACQLGAVTGIVKASLHEGLIFPASHYFLKIGPREWVSSARRKKIKLEQQSSSQPARADNENETKCLT